MSSAEGVGALDACAAASLRDALFSAASDVHADAAAVLADAPPTTIFLRPSPGGDGGDLETHVAVALFWGVRRREREARAGTVGDAGEEASEAAETAEASRTVAVTSRFGVERALTSGERQKECHELAYRTSSAATSTSSRITTAAVRIAEKRIHASHTKPRTGAALPTASYTPQASIRAPRALANASRTKPLSATAHKSNFGGAAPPTKCS